MGGATVRPSLAAACLAAPPIAVAGAILVMLLAAPLGWHPLWPDTRLTASEAVAIGDDAAFVRLIAAGADPDAVSSVGPGLRQSRERRLTPLEAAIIRGRAEQLKTVAMMGATVNGEVGRRAVCLAYEESPELVPVLWGLGAPHADAEACREER